MAEEQVMREHAVKQGLGAALGKEKSDVGAHHHGTSMMMMMMMMMLWLLLISRHGSCSCSFTLPHLGAQQWRSSIAPSLLRRW
jgi:hypothetical protein